MGKIIRSEEYKRRQRAAKAAQWLRMTEEEREAKRQKVREWRAKPENHARHLAVVRAYHHKKVSTPEGRKAERDRLRKLYRSQPKAVRSAKAKAYNLKRTEYNKTYRGRDYVKAKKIQRYYDDKVETILDEQEIVRLNCTKCGTWTKSETGLCPDCRKTTCRICAKEFTQRWIGQRVHETCRPKDDEVAIYF